MWVWNNCSAKKYFSKRSRHTNFREKVGSFWLAREEEDRSYKQLDLLSTQTGIC